MRHGVSITLLQEKRQEQEEWERSGAAEHSPSHPLGPSSTSGPSTLLYAELTPSKTSSPTSSTSPTSPVTPVTHTPALREIPTPVEALRGPTSHANATSGARAARLTRFSEGTGESRRSPPRASRPRSLRSNNSRSSHSLLLPPQQPSSHNVSQARLTLRAAAPQGQKLVRTTAVSTYELTHLRTSLARGAAPAASAPSHKQKLASHQAEGLDLDRFNATEPPITPETTQGLSLTHPRMRSYSIARRSTSRI